MEEKSKSVDMEGILKLIPHRYPFLLVDKVIDYKVDDSIRAIKNITVSEPCFTGHFPDYPVMPGVLLIESLAQSCGLLMRLSNDVSELSRKDYMLLVGVDETRFRRQVIPGDCVVLEANLIRKKQKLCRFSARAVVDNYVVCETKLTIAHQQ